MNIFLSIALLFLSSGKPAPPPAESVLEMTDVIEAFRARLGISELVRVVIRRESERLVSVQRSPQRPNLFEIRFDPDFLATLDDSEVRAAIAHEFGHIWIFTHHPYLQTERLANQKAMKLVPRSELLRIYEKMETYRGESRDLTEILGQ